MQILKLSVTTTFILCFIILLPPFIINPIFSTLDDSWGFGLGIATQKNLTFGTDVVFTYGPLHFLIVKQGNLPLFKFVILIFELSIVAFITSIFLDIYNKMQHNFKGIILITVAFIFSNINCEYYLTFIFIYSAFQILIHQKNTYILALYFISCVSFFIKINYGFFYIFFMMYVLTAISIKNKKNFIYLFLSVIFTFITIYQFSIILNTDFKNYVLNGFEIIDGYIDSMNTPFIVTTPAYWYSYIILCLFIYLQYNYRNIVFSSTYIYFFLLFYGFLFLAFKNGIVRIDGHHYFIFIFQFPVYFLFYYLLLNNHKKLNIAIIAVIFFSTINIFHGLYNNVVLKKTPRITKKMLYDKVNIWSYFPSLFSPVYSELNPPIIPKDYQLSQISKQTIDVFPVDISLMLKYQLNYLPRPVLQSYSAYNLKLDSLNSKKINSINSPIYLLFLNQSIDNRVPFWDESITKRSILKNYAIIKNTYSIKDSVFLLFKKRQSSKIESKTEILHYKTTINKFINVPSDSSDIYLYATINYNIIGKILRFLIKSPNINVSFLYDDNSNETYKCIIPILKTGVLINKKVTTNAEAYQYFSNNKKSLKTIKSFKFSCDFGIKNEIDIMFLKVNYY